MQDNLHEEIAMTALNDMFKKGHFSICTIDSVARVLKRHVNNREYEMLRALHCVDFASMPKSVYEALPDLIRTCLGLTTIYEFEHLKQKTIMVSPIRRMVKLIGGGA